MKFLRLAFYVLIAQLVLSGCAGEGVEETSSSSSSEINFDACLGRNASTRAGETNIASLQKSGFGVFARYNHNGAISSLMDNEHVTWNENHWGYTNTRYWPNEGTVDFFAYAPRRESASLNLEDNHVRLYHSTSNENVDLVWACKSTVSKSENNAVKLKFEHSLAKISFKILSDALDRDTVNGAQIILKSVKLCADSVGNGGVFIDGGYLNFATGKWDKDDPLSPRTVYTWTSKTDTTKKEGFLLSSDTINYKNTSITVSDKSYLFILPQTKNYEFYLIVDYVLKHADGKEEPRQAKGLVNSKHFMDFVAGKAYNFVLNIPLDPIQVDAEVEKWPSTKKKTRAAEEEEGTNTGISEFIDDSKLGLFAFHAQDSTTASDSLFMSNLNNTKVGEKLTYRDNTWNYSPKRFWPQTGILHFYAGYPYFMEFKEFNENGKVHFTTPDYNRFGVDFLWGSCNNNNNNVECSSHPNLVTIKMKHALARVNIYFEDYGDVNNVQVAASREGTFTSTSPEGIPIWEVNHSLEDELVSVKKKIKDPAAILFVFPGKINKLRFYSSLKKETIDLPNFGTDTPENFKAGKEYNICVSPNRIDYDYVPPK